MIISGASLAVEAELGEYPIYITYGSMESSGHVVGTTERLGHFLGGRSYPETEAELRRELERFVE